jgi:hypothetical protein
MSCSITFWYAFLAGKEVELQLAHQELCITDNLPYLCCSPLWVTVTDVSLIVVMIMNYRSVCEFWFYSYIAYFLILPTNKLLIRNKARLDKKAWVVHLHLYCTWARMMLWTYLLVMTQQLREPNRRQTKCYCKYKDDHMARKSIPNYNALCVGSLH